MLTAISLEAFKCFRGKTTLPLGRFNVLAGVNGRGKSSALQPLLCMAQTLAARFRDSIQLNGVLIELGTMSEVRSRDVPAREPMTWAFEFEVEGWWRRYEYSLLTSAVDELRAQVARVVISGGSESEVNYEREFVLDASGKYRESKSETAVEAANRTLDDIDVTLGVDQHASSALGQAALARLHYLCAERLGPRSFAPRSSLGDWITVGPRGEYTAEVLAWTKRDQVQLEEARCVPGDRARSEIAQTVYDQTGAWLSEIFEGGAIEVETPDPAIHAIRMNSDGRAQFVRPLHTGFGFSYVLPVIVAGLIARAGEMLVVENPEAHLHPMAQSRLAQFLGRVAAAGIQVFVETHSENVLLGARLALKDGTLSQPDDISVLYFGRDAESPVQRIPVEGEGRIRIWPDGFFDQTSSDLAQLHDSQARPAGKS